MIIFDLDNTLTDCSHRQHFVDPSKNPECEHILNPNPGINYQKLSGWYYKDRYKMCEPPIRMKFIPDWRSFHESCSEDKPIRPTLEVLSKFIYGSDCLEIWSGRCESVREKTVNWLIINWFWGLYDFEMEALSKLIKMRPIGDNTPDDQLKERWLNERCADLIEAQIGGIIPVKHDIDFVVDADERSIEMWRRRGVFVFNVCQHEKEF